MDGCVMCQGSIAKPFHPFRGLPPLADETLFWGIVKLPLVEEVSIRFPEYSNDMI